MQYKSAVEPRTNGIPDHTAAFERSCRRPRRFRAKRCSKSKVLLQAVDECESERLATFVVAIPRHKFLVPRDAGGRIDCNGSVVCTDFK